MNVSTEPPSQNTRSNQYDIGCDKLSLQAVFQQIFMWARKSFFYPTVMNTIWSELFLCDFKPLIQYIRSCCAT